MEQAIYLAHKFWRMAGSPRPVHAQDVLRCMRFKIGTRQNKPAAIITKPWDRVTLETLNPPAAAIQIFENPDRIDCRYEPRPSKEDNRYIEAYLVGYVLLAMDEKSGSVCFNNGLSLDNSDHEVHRFARTLLVPDDALNEMLSRSTDESAMMEMADTFQVSPSVLTARLYDLGRSSLKQVH